MSFIPQWLNKRSMITYELLKQLKIEEIFTEQIRSEIEEFQSSVII